jgi:hypothetical protein
VPARESLILDGVELNDLTSDYVLRSIDFPVPKKRYEWVTGADADGAWLVRDPLFENRTIPMSLRVAQQATMDQALAKIAVLVGKLEEAEQQPDGLPLVWTPANSTKSITFHVLTGELDGIPVTRDGADRGWLRNYPIVNLTLTCRPFGYGALVSAAATASGSTPLVTVDVPSVAGDVPAEGTIVVTDLATKSRRDALWGIEQRYYTPGGGAAPLTLAAGSLVTTGFAGTAGTLAGAYLSNVISASVAEQPTAICGTGNQPHIGTYRVRARVQAGSVAARFRLAWQDGDGPFGANPWIAVPAAGGWCEIDLGPITIEPSALGTQRWTGRIEALTSDGAAQTVYVNLLELIPAGEGYGRARAAYTYKPGVVVARDDFAGFTSGNLNGRTAPAGGAWTTAGDTTDFAGQPVGSSPTSDFGAGAVVRQTGGPEFVGRYAVLGPALTDTEVGTKMWVQNPAGLANTNNQGVAARYVDTQNVLRAFFNQNTQTLSVNRLLANSGSAVSVSVPVVVPANWFPAIRLVVYASGRVIATLTDPGGAVIGIVDVPAGTWPELATGGALASGKAGLYDQGVTSSHGRYYGKFYAAIPSPEPVVVNSGQSIEFRANADALRRDASGTYGGRAPAYRGGRVLIPAAGAPGRTSRVVVAARRNDTDAGVDGGVTDNTQVVVQYTPRYLAVPH